MTIKFEQIHLLSAVRSLERTPRWQSRLVLLKVLGFYPNPHPLVREFIERLESCARPITMELREMTNGEEHWVEIAPNDPDRGLVRETFVRGCGHPLCPWCVQHWTDREAAKAWKKVLRIIGKPHRKDFSHLTLDIITAPLGEDFKPFAARFKKKVIKLLDRRLPGSLLVGGFHVNRTDTGMGKLHFHGWLHCRTVKPKVIVQVLEKAFSGLDELHLEPMKLRNSIRWNFNNVVKYASDQKLMVKKLRESTPEVLHDWVLSLELLRGQGRRGLRFEKGLKGDPTDKDAGALTDGVNDSLTSNGTNNEAHTSYING